MGQTGPSLVIRNPRGMKFSHLYFELLPFSHLYFRLLIVVWVAIHLLYEHLPRQMCFLIYLVSNNYLPRLEHKLYSRVRLFVAPHLRSLAGISKRLPPHYRFIVSQDHKAISN